MGRNILVEALRANEAAKGKKSDDYFDCNASVISYSTGFPVLDYYLGYKVNVYDDDGNFVSSYPSLGITAGSYVLFVGKPSTSKTATAVKEAGADILVSGTAILIAKDYKTIIDELRK